MPIKYALYRNNLTGNDDDYYAQLRARSSVGFDEIAERVVGMSTMEPLQPVFRLRTVSVVRREMRVVFAFHSKGDQMSNHQSYYRKPLLFLIGMAVFFLANTGFCAEESFVDRCRAYAEEHDVLPGRWMYEPFQSEELMELLGSGNVDDWKKALADDDPKVRTLGILAIGLGDDPLLLPLLEPFLADRTRTFDQLVVGRMELADTYEAEILPPFNEKQDVARVAASMVSEWTSLHYCPRADEFKAYWQKVTDPEKLIAAWRCRLERAGREAVRIQSSILTAAWKERSKRNADSFLSVLEAKNLRERARVEGEKPLVRVCERMEKELPARLQVLIALSVESSIGAIEFWSNEERATLARRHIPRDFALACLRRDPPFDDPYLSPDSRDARPYIGLCKQLLLNVAWKPEDAEVLLKLEAEDHEREDSFELAEWAIGASRAANERGRSIGILKDAMGRFPRAIDDIRRVQLVEEIWDVARVDEEEFIKEFLYQDVESSAHAFRVQRELVNHVSKSGKEAKLFIYGVLIDKRSEDLPWVVVRDIAICCSRLSGENVISADELNSLEYPAGKHIFSTHEGFEEAKMKYPEETEKVLKTVEEWRKRLVDYVERHDW